MAESNGIFVNGLPRHTQVEELWKLFISDGSKVDYVLFPFAGDKSVAYVHFAEHPGQC